MQPTSGQIAEAAYYRWERRNFAHGRHEHDWYVAEQELAFAAQYEIIARYRLDGIAPHLLGDPRRPRCRFCERTAPRATFTGPRLAAPAALGNAAIVSVEACDDCRAQYDETVGGDLDRFVRAALRSDGESRPFVPIAALKGLTWAALMLLPPREMEYFEDAVEWVSNPDHDLDSRSIDGAECVLHRLPEPGAFSWAGLARRVDDDSPLPYVVAFFATGDAVFQVALPLSSRDDELEGPCPLPRVAWPFGGGRGPLDSHHVVIPLAAAAPSRAARLSPFGA